MSNEQMQITDKLPGKEQAERERLESEIIDTLRKCHPIIPKSILEQHSEKMQHVFKNFSLPDLRDFLTNFQQIPSLAKKFNLLLSNNTTRTDFFIKILPIYNKINPIGEIINKKINYELITNLPILANYYLTLKKLRENIFKSGYPDNLLERVQNDLTRSIEEILLTNFSSLSNALEEITTKIKYANENFSKNNPLRFTETVSNIFNINFHD